MDTGNRYVVIMAGGGGTRLWPMSRRDLPKQFLELIGEGTLLQQTFRHVTEVVPADHIMVMADATRAARAQEQLADLTAENVFIEPSAKDNGPAIALASLLLEQRFPGCQMAIIWSDHYIQQPVNFKRALETAFSALESHPDHLISVGVKPTRAATEFGYIRLGHETELSLVEPVFTVEQFVEKPDRETAEKYIADWHYLWNTGYKVFAARTMLELFRTHQPAYGQVLDEMADAIRANAPDSINQLWEKLEKRDIERLITEKTRDILVVPADLGWSDVGSWDTLHTLLSDGEDSDLVARANHIDVGSRNCLIMADKRLVATAGLDNVVIVDTPDALLVIDKDRAQAVKELVEQLKELKADHLL